MTELHVFTSGSASFHHRSAHSFFFNASNRRGSRADHDRYAIDNRAKLICTATLPNLSFATIATPSLALRTRNVPKMRSAARKESASPIDGLVKPKTPRQLARKLWRKRRKAKS